MIFATQNPFGCEQSFDTDRTTGMNASRWNAHFSTQTETETVGKAWTCIVEHTSAIDLFLEKFGRMFCAKWNEKKKYSSIGSSQMKFWMEFTIFGDDDICVTAAECMNMVDGFIKIFDNFNGYLECT